MIGFIISEYDSESEKNRWYHYDRLGNVMDLSNGNGKISASYEQDAFGNVLSGSASGYHLTTKEYDSNIQLYYFYHRWYDPTLGGFTQKDSIKSNAESTYIYCSNNPLRQTDPLGLKATEEEKKAEKECRKKCKKQRGFGGCSTKAERRCRCFAECMQKKSIYCYARLWYGTWPTG